MPRETVHTDVRPYGDDVPAVSAVEVTWSRESQHVQMATVLLNADDGSPFHPGSQLHGSSGTFYGTVTGPGDSWFPNTPFPIFPGQQPYHTGDPLPTVTIPMVPVDSLVPDDWKTGWCEQCKAGQHDACADDTAPHQDQADPWCRCPCGEIKQSLVNEEDTVTVGLPDRTDAPAGHYVQLNRKELNELIRKLKRAGAQAFGHDEW